MPVQFDLERLRETIEHAAHLLPAQGPITAFVHHNTLHAFEDLPFKEAVVKGADTFGCHPYLPEERYRQKLSRGRILPEDVEAVLMEELEDQGDDLLGFFGTRFQLRMAMLAHPLRTGTANELRWIIAETDALTTVREEVPSNLRDQLLAGTTRWIMRDFRNGQARNQKGQRIRASLDPLFELFDKQNIESWSEATWESFSLHALWIACRDGAMQCAVQSKSHRTYTRHRDLLLAKTGSDTDDLVHDVLIRLTAAFLDQGFADWTLPSREAGLYQAFLRLYSDHAGVTDRWTRGLATEARRLIEAGISPLESIDESLQMLGVEEGQEQVFIADTLLALRGYAGMIWQLETRGDRAARQIPPGSLVEFLAVRLILDRTALGYVAREEFDFTGALNTLLPQLRAQENKGTTTSVDQRAFEVFQLAQVVGWLPEHLFRLSADEWTQLFEEIDAFPSLERRCIYHLAFERRYRIQALDAVANHCRRIASGDTAQSPNKATRPSMQVITCIDDREESFRRHLEEVEPACETFGAAGFFAIAMYYRGAADAHFTPLCPVSIKPQQYVVEKTVYSFAKAGQQRRNRRRIIGTVTRHGHNSSRTFAGGWLAALLGSLASVPLVMRIVFPRTTTQLQKFFGDFVLPPVLTNLHLERTQAEPGPEPDQVGYSVTEMAAIVERVLRDIGLTQNLSRMIVLCGHGSSSLNNPHESAYNCGACAGARGGPNARAFAQMANDPRVRELVVANGIPLPDDSVFVGAYHNTCDDSVEFYDLDRLPTTHSSDFEQASDAIQTARGRNAHERCRRFYSAPLSLTDQDALKHVEGRANDLSQARPEYNHATNALCFVGQREWSRNLFLDRRAFLQSYDPAQDDADHSILTRVLQAAIPVCAGINLEYYFSCVDPVGWGAGNKLPHNIAALLGVMDGASSDLRPGLYRQMIEIHEPMRLLFVIETTPAVLLNIMAANEGMDRLVRGSWVQVATVEPESGTIMLFQSGEFVPYYPSTNPLPIRTTSLDWYRGWRDHLGFASISADAVSNDEPVVQHLRKGH
ncbi:hypothetical protein HG15A2_35730 [Adhaeretor mobilis]|uniref:Probable inorganic carbon transporter subunit DabA n=1 Tax=Adhaeretor mobilis TaxID=1930276 RepID=A0A517MZD4_9BACT|nr:hypothetical protein HG15A2_35730 [Adhaeretor mobilis]